MGITAYLVAVLRFALLVFLFLFLFKLARSLFGGLRETVDAGETGRAMLVLVEDREGDVAPGKVFNLKANNSLGRVPENDLVLPDKAVSGHHALIYNRGGRYWVEDQESANGTWVNGKRLKRPQVLEPGDVLEIGQVKLEFGRLSHAGWERVLGRNGSAD